MTTISTSIDSTITLGSSAYPDPLIVASTGSVIFTGYTGAVGVYSLTAGVSLTNFGSINGGNGPALGNAGGAVELTAGGTVYNAGSISGGHGYLGAFEMAAGGVGVLLGGGILQNAGAIRGGNGGGFPGGNAGNGDGAGGNGATLNGVALSNSGLIDGGLAYGGVGGSGVYASGGTVSNVASGRYASATISGGGGDVGGIGGVGLDLASGSATNGAGGIIDGGGAQYGRGGYGVRLTAGASLTNGAGGTINGGGGFMVGSSLSFSSESFGAAGAFVIASTLSNSGAIQGGSSATQFEGIAGGAGVDLGMAGVLTNDGVITGGSATAVFPTALAGIVAGGEGVNLRSGSMLTNSGHIVGGTAPDVGGIGIYLGAGAAAINTGSIYGGHSSVAPPTVATAGGAGVFLNGGTLIDAGLVGGGGGTTAGDAVQFGAQAASTLVVEAGATFAGAIGGFRAGDTVDFANLSPTQVASDFDASTATFTTALDGTLQFSGTFIPGQFQFNLDGSGGTDVTVLSTIATVVAHTVTLGSAAYPSPLTIAAAGSVNPGAGTGADGMYSLTLDASLTNAGSVFGGGAAAYGVGGIGVDFCIDGTINNSGFIAGGSASTNAAGGVGTYLFATTLNNSGNVYGGNGTVQSSGVAVYSHVGTVNNAVAPGTVGYIAGGRGYQGGNGGTAVVLDGGSGTNGAHGLIRGGSSANGSGGIGVLVSSYAVFANEAGGRIVGGVSTQASGIAGESAGAGILVSEATVTNAGSIYGGNVFSATGGAAGVGANLAAGASLTNDGSISGGRSSLSYFLNNSYVEPVGGIGVNVTSGASLINHGDIFGGAGYGSLRGGGIGGAGVSLDGTATATNSGSIFGGYFAGNAAGGVGVLLNGGTLTDSGLISATQANAVQFGGAASTLIVEAGASFVGDIGGFRVGDTIDVTNLTPTQLAADFNATTHTLTTPLDGTLQFGGAYTGYGFIFSDDGGGGTTLTVAPQSVVSSTVATTVTPGSGAYSAAVAVGSGAVVQPSTAGAAGVSSNTAGVSLANAGAIYGGAAASGAGGIAVNLTALATVSNSGSIAGGASTTGTGGIGVYLNGGTLINAGSISGGVGSAGTAAAVQFGSAAATLVVDPTALFNGAVVANTAAYDTLKLAGTVDPTLAGFGTQFTGFSALQFGSGAAWTVDASAASLTGPSFKILGFAATDTLDVTDLSLVPGATTTFDASSDVLTVVDGATTLNLHFDNPFTGEVFALTADGAGTAITLQSAACYRRGTRILTARGERPIETLAIGDHVLTRSGALCPIRWIGRRHYSGYQAAFNRDVLPVRIAAGALGEDARGAPMPRRDLWVSPEHAMWIDEMLIPARALLNGTDITQEEEVMEIEYLHLELATHEVIFAEGAPSESFVDDHSRELFDNAAEYARLYPDDPEALRGPARFCAPRVEEGFALEAVRQRLATPVGRPATRVVKADSRPAAA